MHDELLTCQEIAGRFGIDQQAAMDRIRRSGWPGFRGNDGEIRFKVSRWRIPPPINQGPNAIANNGSSAEDLEYRESKAVSQLRGTITSQMAAIRSEVAELNEAFSLIETKAQPTGVTHAASIKSEIDAISGEIRKLRIENGELWERLEVQNNRIVDGIAVIDCMERLLTVIDRFIVKANRLVENAKQNGMPIHAPPAIAEELPALPPSESRHRPNDPMNITHHEQTARKLRGNAVRAGVTSFLRKMTKG